MSRANYAKRVQIFMFDMIVLVPFLLLLAIPTAFTFYLCLSAFILLFILNKKGLTLDMLGRKLRTFAVGRMRYIRPSWRKEL